MNDINNEDFDPNPFNFKPLKRRKNPALKSPKAKRVKNTKSITSQKPTHVQKTLSFRTERENPVEGVRASVCPVCQLPLDLLKGLVSANVHIADCRGMRLRSVLQVWSYFLQMLPWIRVRSWSAVLMVEIVPAVRWSTTLNMTTQS